MTEKKEKQPKSPRKSKKAAAEEAYSQAILRHSVGDKTGALAALEHSIRLNPKFAPAILTMGSVEYQREQQAEGKRLLFSLLSLPRTTENLFSVIDEAGSFLISVNQVDDAFELYREAARKFPKVAQFHQRVGYCSAQEGLFEEALASSQRAIELDPDNAAYVSDFGWTLVLAERYQEAEAAFLRALDMDPSDERAQANLQYCRERLAENSST
jgi:tetratricopeptide (TPR) repeat protein